MLGTGFGFTTLAERRKSAFTPAELSGLVAWYDPSDLTTLYQDVAMTVPVTATGQSVAAMRDKSGHGYHLTQATASKRPLYKTDGTLHWLESDGVDDELTIASRFGLAANPDLSVIAGMRWIGTKAQARVFGIGSGTGSLNGSCGTDGWAWRFDAGYASFGTNTVNTDVVATWMRQNATNFGASQFWRNGVQRSLDTSSNASGLPSNTTAVFSMFQGGTSSTTFANIRLYGLVLGNFFDRTRAAQVEAWMARKSGVTL